MTVNYEQIENYLHGGLSAADHTAFEAEMTADPALADAVNLYREVETQLQGSIKATAGEAALKEQLEALNQQYFGKKGGATAAKAPVVAISRRRIFYYIASAAAVLLILLWIRPFGGNATFDADAVYAQFGPYEVSSWGEVRGGNDVPGDSVGALKMKVDSLFNLNPPNYAAALPILEKIATIDIKDPQVALAQAACYTETNDSARAMQTITTVETQAQGELKNQAIFYKAKLYIKYKDVEGCRQALQAISGGDWGARAQELLKALPK
jgi:hypothetical protein